MNSAKKLQPIEKIRKQQENNAGRQHGESIRLAEQQKAQLDELLSYRDQYSKAFHAACESGLSAIQLQEYKVFLSRLDDAIAQQTQQVNQGQQNCEQSRQQWIDKRNKRKMLSKVVENRQQTELNHKERCEQKSIEDRPQKVNLLGTTVNS